MLFELPMIIYLVTFGTIYLAITFKIRRLPGKTAKDFGNELLTSIMWYVGAVIYPFAYSPDITTETRDYFNIFTDIAMIGIFLVILFIVTREKILLIKKPEIKDTRDFESFAINFKSEYTLKRDIDRKAFHLIIPAFVLFMYILGTFLASWLSIGFVSGHDLGIFLIINCGFGGLFLFAAADMLRLSYFFKDQGISVFHLLPTTVLNILTKRMHAKELFTFIPTVLILLSFIPFLPAPFAVFGTITLIASISDAMASIFGKAFSQSFPGHGVFPSSKYRYFKSKTIAGYLAGFIATFLIAWVMLIAFPVPELSLNALIWTPLLTATAFILVDILSLQVNDNFLNPVVCGLVMLACLLIP
ncbi:MAG TPA: hypothetical protein VKM55_21165 [Candidatus Lokiarchaeia archaeon]|nr:hypothetical protein [Candidatus Lokiarchaeia archaeon]